MRVQLRVRVEVQVRVEVRVQVQVALHRLVAVEGIPVEVDPEVGIPVVEGIPVGVVPEVGIPAVEGIPAGVGIPALVVVAANSLRHFFQLNLKSRNSFEFFHMF